MERHPIRWMRAKAAELIRLKDRPHAIALGVAYGTFWGFIPLWGFKTLLAMGFARLFRGNVVAAAIAVTLHDLTLPIGPMLLRWEYDLGYWLLSRPHAFPPSLSGEHHGFGKMLHWETLMTVGRPLLLGSVIAAVPISLAAYAITLALMKRRQAE